MTFSLISYDITDDTRRTRIYQLLRNHGERVQYSVFECHLPDKKLQELRNQLFKLIDPRVDSVRIYRLCKKCLFGVEVVGAGRVPEGVSELPNIV